MDGDGTATAALFGACAQPVDGGNTQAHAASIPNLNVILVRAIVVLLSAN
jgi:hypothetical protein